MAAIQELASVVYGGRPVNSAVSPQKGLPRAVEEGAQTFQSVLDADSCAPPANVYSAGQGRGPVITDISPTGPSFTPARSRIAAAYQKQLPRPTRLNNWEKYKDDQLLSNPGGDRYDHHRKKVVTPSEARDTFWGRISKDISDGLENVKNFFKNALFGAKRLYRDRNNQIREAANRGLFGSLVDCVKNVGRALSFGLWHEPDEKPVGFRDRIGFFVSKMKKAVFGDLMQGATGSAIHMGEDVALAGWNLVETVPDATIGNFEAGRSLTTALFDNGQVAIDYVTDILPTGEAWSRVHASDLSNPKNLKVPIQYNLQRPEHFTDDVRWQYVRNTPFRKTIETVGSLLSDIMAVRFFGEGKFFSHDQRKRN